MGPRNSYTYIYSPCRPSTPIYKLMENKYQEEWIRETREMEGVVREEEMRKKLRGKVYETRSTLLRRFSEPVEPPPHWKMKRWSEVSELGRLPHPWGPALV